MKKANESKAAEKFEVEILRANEVKEGLVAFSMKVNGVTIYDCWYREYQTKEGKDGNMISFPSEKDKDGKYYNKVWFPISAELKEEIIDLLADVVNSGFNFKEE